MSQYLFSKGPTLQWVQLPNVRAPHKEIATDLCKCHLPELGKGAANPRNFRSVASQLTLSHFCDCWWNESFVYTWKWMLCLHLWTYSILLYYVYCMRVYIDNIHTHVIVCACACVVWLWLDEVSWFSVHPFKGSFHKCPLRWAYAQKYIKTQLVLISVPLSAKEHHHRSRRVHIPRPWITVIHP